MIRPDQNLALRDLARSIRICVETLGPTCTAQLLAVVALDLVSDGESDNEKVQPLPQAERTPA